MWAEKEKTRYEEYLERNWTKDGRFIMQPLPPIPSESAHAIAFYKLMADVGRELDVAIKLFPVTRKFLLTTSSVGQDKLWSNIWEQ